MFGRYFNGFLPRALTYRWDNNFQHANIASPADHLRAIDIKLCKIDMTVRIKQHTASVADSPQHAEVDIERRFGGVARLYGGQGLERLRAANVCVIGVGGVGSWAVEALARSAVGGITMIDMDIVAESNINRQLPALDSTLGRDKTAVLRERIQQINPGCRISIEDQFLSKQNISQLVTKKFDFVLDCIDDFRVKAALIHYCKQEKVNLVTLGGAGGQRDPSKIRLADLGKTQHDVLLARTRKLLRQDYRFPRNTERSFGIACIYSDEQPMYPDGAGGLSPQRPSQEHLEPGSNNALNCAGGLGSITHVTASFGLFAAAHVINQIVG